jgi:hypothetical protein
MNGQPTAILMAVASTRRNLHEPPREPSPRRTRRVAARVLQAAAHRLDPRVAPAPSASLS